MVLVGQVLFVFAANDHFNVCLTCGMLALSPLSSASCGIVHTTIIRRTYLIALSGTNSKEKPAFSALSSRSAKRNDNSI